jgi:hypothetical protein
VTLAVLVSWLWIRRSIRRLSATLTEFEVQASRDAAAMGAAIDALDEAVRAVERGR